MVKKEVEVIPVETLIKERDELSHRIVNELRTVRDELAELDVTEQILWSDHRIRSDDIFGEFDGALRYLFENKAYKSDQARAAFDVPPKISRKEQLVASCERNLEKQRDALRSIKSLKKKTYSKDDVMREPSVDEVEKVEERVRLAEIQLARARGEMDKYEASLQAEIEQKREKERQERLSQAYGVKRIQDKYLPVVGDKR